MSLGEDRLFCYEYLKECRGIAAISDVTYIHDAMDMNSLTYRRYPSKVNEYKYKVFKEVVKSLVCVYSLDFKENSFLCDYLEGLYSAVLVSYKDEEKYFKYYSYRVLHKLNLLWKRR